MIREESVVSDGRCASTYRAARDPLSRWPEMEGRRCQSTEGHPGAHVWADGPFGSVFVSWQ